MRKWFYAASALVLSTAIWLMPMDYDVHAEGVATVSDGDTETETDDSSTETKIQLTAPENVSWSGWYASWDEVTLSGGYYSVHVYKNDTNIAKFAMKPADGTMIDVVAQLQKLDIEMEEGASYSVAVTADANAYPEMYKTSELSVRSEKQVWGEVSTIPMPKVEGINDGYRFCYTSTAAGRYETNLLKDGEVIFRRTSKLDANEANRVSILNEIDESGVYQCRVRYVDNTNADSPILGEWVVSDELVYAKPEKKLTTASVAWDLEQTAVAKFTLTEDCGGYCLQFWKLNKETGVDELSYTNSSGSSFAAGKVISCSIPSNHLAGNGKYRVRVRQYSTDITAVAHSDWSEFSDYLLIGDEEEGETGKEETGKEETGKEETGKEETGKEETGKEETEVKDVVESVVAQSKTDAAAAITTIINRTDITELRVAMQADVKVQEQIGEVENNYAIQQDIHVVDATASAEAKKFISTEKIKMVGAAFNAVAGKSINLDVTMPAEKKQLNSAEYGKNVQLDIKLITNGAEKHGKLLVPITITMPVPDGIDVDELKIIHYFVDGGDEIVQFKDSGDGTITFTVDQFSTFVFAETAEDGGDGEDDKDDDEDDEDEDEDEAPVAVPVKDAVPKTGDSLPIALPMAAAVVFAGAALAFRKREE